MVINYYTNAMFHSSGQSEQEREFLRHVQEDEWASLAVFSPLCKTMLVDSRL